MFNYTGIRLYLNKIKCKRANSGNSLWISNVDCFLICDSVDMIPADILTTVEQDGIFWYSELLIFFHDVFLILQQGIFRTSYSAIDGEIYHFQFFSNCLFWLNASNNKFCTLLLFDWLNQNQRNSTTVYRTTFAEILVSLEVLSCFLYILDKVV